MKKMVCHALERTSPKGGPFLGYCILCGKENLPIAACGKKCSNPRNVSRDDAIISAIEGRTKN